MSRTLFPTGSQVATFALASRNRRWAKDDLPRECHCDGDGAQRARKRGTRPPAPVRRACAVGIVLMALCALAPAAFGMPSAWPHFALTGSEEMRSGGGQFVPATTAPESGHHYTGHQTEIQSSEVSLLPADGFDWADASVGGAVTLVLGVALAGGVVLLNRRWLRAQLPVGSRP